MPLGHSQHVFDQSRINYPGVSKQETRPTNQIGASDFDATAPAVDKDQATPIAEERTSQDQNADSLRDSFKLDWVVGGSNPNSPPLAPRIDTSQSRLTGGLKLPVKRQSKSSSAKNLFLGNRPPQQMEGKMQAAASYGHGHGQASGSGVRPESGSLALDLSNELIETNSSNYFQNDNLEGQLTESVPEQVKQRISDDYNNQLDEPILDTLTRDLSGIYNKMKIIALPLSSYDIYKVVLRGWDLWGPLLLCTFLAFSLHQSEGRGSRSGPHFADVFVLVWFGSCVVSLNYRLLSMSSVSSHAMASHVVVAENYETSTRGQTGEAPISSSASGSGTGTEIASGGDGSNEPRFQTLVSPPSIFQLMCVFGYCLVAPCFGLILLKLFSFDRLLFERIIVGLLFGFAWPTFCSVRILIRYQHPEKRALAIYPIGLFYFIVSCMIILNH